MIEGFPTYRGKPLPGSLRFYDPRHWLLVLVWVFFRPSHLRQYLHQAIPEDLYFASGYPALVKTVKLRPVASLLTTALIGTLMAALLVTLTLNICGIPVLWYGVALGVAVGVAFGVAVGAFGVVFSVAFSMALGVAFGVPLGVISGVAFGGLPLGMLSGVLPGVLKSVVPFVAGAIAAGVAVGVALDSIYDVAHSVAFGVALGVAVGVAFGVAFGVVFGVAVGVAAGVAFGVSMIVSSTRLFFWFPETLIIAGQLLARGGTKRARWHPATWDENSVIPLPRTVEYATSALSQGTTAGSQVMRVLLRNQFQGWAVRRSVLSWLTTADDPLVRFYELLQTPVMEESAIEPLTQRRQQRGIRVRTALLAQLADRPVKYDDFGQNPGITDRLTWRLSRLFMREQSDSAAKLFRYYALILLSIEGLNAVEGRYSKGFTPYILVGSFVDLRAPDGPIEWLLSRLRSHPEIKRMDELADQWEKLGNALRVHDLMHIIDTDWSPVSVVPHLVPEIGAFLIALTDVSIQVQIYSNSTNLVRKATALNQATGLLQELSEICEKIDLTEGILARAIVAKWLKLTNAASGELGSQTARDLALAAPRSPLGVSELLSEAWQHTRILPYENPFVMGRPVEPPLFVGRRNLMSRIAEQWSAGVIPDSIILYGHRRMGKSSILRNLGEYAPVGSLVVYFDLKSARATIQQPGDLLFNLASAIFDEASKHWPDLAEPDQYQYTNSGAAVVQFRRLVGRVTELLPEHTFLVLALDEFEAIESAVETGQLTAQIYDWLRALSQTPKVALIMAGLHTLDEMSRNYQQAFFDSYRNEKVSYLTLEASTQLITRPTPDFSLDYDRAVVAEIHRLTAGQPLLIQRICSELVSHLNHQLFDLNLERSQRIGVDDLDAVLTDEFLVSESRYFDGIWRDQIAGYPEQQKVLQVLAQAESGLLIQQIAILSGLTEWATSDALSALQRRDLVIDDGSAWTIIIPLFKRWLCSEQRQTTNRDGEGTPTEPANG